MSFERVDIVGLHVESIYSKKMEQKHLLVFQYKLDLLIDEPGFVLCNFFLFKCLNYCRCVHSV